MMIYSLFIILCSILISSMGYCKDVEEYFPKEEGLKKEFDIIERLPNGETKKGILTVTNLPSKQLQGKKVYPRRYEGTGKSTIYFVVLDKDGCYRLGKQYIGAAEPEIYKDKRYDLKNPIESGTSWSSKWGSPTAKEELADVKATIASINDIVTVPAGTYRNCVKVRRTGEIKRGTVKVIRETYDWYCSDLGWIKTITKEREIAGGRTYERTTQLTSFKKK